MRITTVRSSTTSGLSNVPSDVFHGPVSLLGSMTASNVHLTSAATTGRPSDHFARSSRTNVNSRPSSDTAQRRARLGQNSSVSVSVVSSFSYMRSNIIDVYVLLSM